MKKKKKVRKKSRSKYYVKYGYSISDIAKITGWSTGTVWSYFQDKDLRKAMLADVKGMERYKD